MEKTSTHEPSGESPLRVSRRERLAQWWRDSSRIIRQGRELAAVKQIRRGEWAGETSWVSPSTESMTLHTLPESIDLDSLSGGELRVAVRLDYLSFDTMTGDQQEKWRGASDKDEVAAARGFVRRLAEAGAETQAA
jgi:hypothetical protein